MSGKYTLNVICKFLEIPKIFTPKPLLSFVSTHSMESICNMYYMYYYMYYNLTSISEEFHLNEGRVLIMFLQYCVIHNKQLLKTNAISLMFLISSLHPASAEGVIVLTSCVCLSVRLSVSLSWLNGMTYRLGFWHADVT